ncbi:MAG: SLC13 family permease [Anaerolineales bacterium]|nr:SLC13 family permease [Anaerolineales bacterium]
MQIGLLLFAILVVMVLFTLDKISVELPALGLVLFLVLTGILTPEEAFAGFGSDVVILMLGLLILMAALERTGITDIAGSLLFRQGGESPDTLLLWVMVIAVVVGSFVSNTAATAFFLPVVISFSRRLDVSPGKVLMPLAFASILASSVTLIGTSTNIVVSGMMSSYDLQPLGLFELTPVGVVIAAAGIAYLYFIGRYLVPDRILRSEIDEAASGIFLSEILIPTGSELEGKTLLECGFGRDLDLTVLRIFREGRRYVVPRADTHMRSGDVLLVEGRREGILRAKDAMKVDIRPDVEFALPDISSGDIALTEAILLPGSPLIGRTLSGLDVRQRFGFQVLAINRHNGIRTQKMSSVRLKTADILVVQGKADELHLFERQGLFRILEPDVKLRPRKRRAQLAAGIFLGALVIGGSGIIALPVAVLLGAFLVLATRCITPEEAYSRVNWTVLILIASMLALGRAMGTTGAAQAIAAWMSGLIGMAQPEQYLSLFFFLTLLLTQPMSNQAAAVITLPVAMSVAAQFGWDPRPFAVIIALAASCSFLTPLEPSCLLVYGPGHYRFLDFPRVGLPLSILIYLIAIIMVPRLWPI